MGYPLRLGFAIKKKKLKYTLAINQNTINTNNNVSLEIKRRSTLANRCHLGVKRQLSSRPLSCDEINTL